MKNFRKIDGRFVCEECGLTFKICSTLSTHIGICHNKREYYDKWIKTETEGLCLTCGKQTNYLERWDRGYALFCSKECKRVSPESRNLIRSSLKNTCNQKYGVDAYTQTSEFKEKAIKTWNLKYNVDNPAQSQIIKDKINYTKFSVYGFATYNNSKKARETNIMRYGCISPSQNIEIFTKQQKTSYLIKFYKNTNVYYQGSYELDFLRKFYDKLDIHRGPVIKYMWNEKLKCYYPDFYVPSLNMIVEIKNSYLSKKDEKILHNKAEACIKQGFRFIMIVDKKYDEFYQCLHNASAT